MQRLTKYPLLVEGILKCTLEKDELASLSIALDVAKTTLRLANAVVKENEDWARLVFIQVFFEHRLC
jgi:hypothetical protein